MILPIGDVQKPAKPPYVNYALIGINVFVFLFIQPGLGFDEVASRIFFDKYAFIPAHFAFIKILYSMFMHADILHIGGNMLFLWIAGDNVEDRLGKIGYAAFYLACGYAASLAHYALDMDSFVPTIGASGAIAGVMGAYFLLCPRNQVKVFYWFYWYIGTIYVSAKVAVGFWFVEQLIYFLLGYFNPGTGIAFDAHIGGIIFGFLVALLLIKLRIATPFIATERHTATFRRGGAYSGGSGGANLYTQYSNQRAVFSEPARKQADWISDAYAAPSYTPPWQRPPTGLFTVIARKPIREKMDEIAPVVARLLRTSTNDAASALGANYGVIARGVPGETAYSIEASLAQIGVTALPISEEFTIDLPPVRELRSLSPSGVSVTLYMDRYSLTKRYDEIFLIVAGNVAGVPTVDIYIYQPWSRFRVYEGSAAFDHPTLANIRAVVARMLGTRHIAVNIGVKILVDGGDWAAASFASQDDFDRYCYWLIQMVNAKNRGLA